MKIHSMAILLLLSPYVCLAQGTRGVPRAQVWKDSSAASIIAAFRRDTSMFRHGPELIKSAQKAGQSAKADAIADSLANMVIASERTQQTRELSRGEARVSSEAVLALTSAGTGDEPYMGAADRLIRIHRESRNRAVFLVLMLVDPRKGAPFLREVAIANDVIAFDAVRALCNAAFIPEVSAEGHASAKTVILDISDRKLTKFDNSALRQGVDDCARRIRSIPRDNDLPPVS